MPRFSCLCVGVMGAAACACSCAQSIEDQALTDAWQQFPFMHERHQHATDKFARPSQGFRPRGSSAPQPPRQADDRAMPPSGARQLGPGPRQVDGRARQPGSNAAVARQAIADARRQQFRVEEQQVGRCSWYLSSRISNQRQSFDDHCQGLDDHCGIYRSPITVMQDLNGRRAPAPQPRDAAWKQPQRAPASDGAREGMPSWLEYEMNPMLRL